MLKYPARFEPVEEGGFLVTFRDVPEAITQGDTIDEALFMAADALATAMDFYFEDQRPVPTPSGVEEGRNWLRCQKACLTKCWYSTKCLQRHE